MNTVKKLIDEGIAFHKKNKLNDAKIKYLEVLKIDQKNFQINRLLALIEYSLENYSNSLKLFGECIKAKPKNSEAYSDRAVVYHKLKETQKAEKDYLKAIDIDNNTNALFNYANLLKENNKLNESVFNYNLAIKAKPDFANAYQNRGLVKFIQHKDQEALNDFNEVIKNNSNHANAYFLKSAIELKKENLIEGFKNYEWRWKSSLFFDKIKNFNKRTWDGNEVIKNKTILLYSEQGLGDQIHFIRFVSLIIEKGANVIVEVDPRLLKLFKYATNFKNIYSQGDKLPNFDLQCPIMSLPYKLKIDINSIPNEPYLKCNTENIEKWKKLLDKNHKNIGINWQGGVDPRQDAGRSFRLDNFKEISKIDGIKLFSLQKINGVDQIKNKKDQFNLNIIDNLDNDAPFVDTAELISNLDLIITSDTSIAHLSGALGKKTFLVIQKYAEWRWFENRSDSPWYSNMKIFRQKIDGDWDSVFSAIKDDLIKLFK